MKRLLFLSALLLVFLISVSVFYFANTPSEEPEKIVYLNCPQTICPKLECAGQSCPSCICNYEPAWRIIQGCHIPKEYKNMQTTELTITGYSMQPTLFKGNTLKGVSFEKSMLKNLEGCMILFTQEDERIIHRVKGVYNEYVITQGDNGDTTEKVDFNQIQYLITEVEFT